MNDPPSTRLRVRCVTQGKVVNVCNDDKPASLSPVSPVSVVWGRREGGREEQPASRPLTDRSQPGYCAATVAPAETSGRPSGNYRTQCQINILWTSLSAISVMVGNGVNFSSRKTQFLLGSSRFWHFLSGQEGRVSQWGVISEDFITFRPRLRPENPVKRWGNWQGLVPSVDGRAKTGVSPATIKTKYNKLRGCDRKHGTQSEGSRGRIKGGIYLVSQCRHISVVAERPTKVSNMLLTTTTTTSYLP